MQDAASTAMTASASASAAGPPPANTGVVSKSRSLQQRKRKRLNAVLDKISNHISSNGNISNGRANSHGNNNEDPVDVDNNKMFGRTEQESSAAQAEASAAASSASSRTLMTTGGRKMSSAALRRELWRDNHQQSVDQNPLPPSITATATTAANDQVFR